MMSNDMKMMSNDMTTIFTASIDIIYCKLWVVNLWIHYFYFITHNYMSKLY